MGTTGRKRPAELEYTPTNCHARDVLARVGDTWSVYVMHILGDARTLRFNELRKEVDGISQRMRTVTLRGLERDGLVARTVYPEVPPRVEYSLTPLALRCVRSHADWWRGRASISRKSMPRVPRTMRDMARRRASAWPSVLRRSEGRQ
jgi:DNA-binding HxlR family transcriptional regulator